RGTVVGNADQVAPLAGNAVAVHVVVVHLDTRAKQRGHRGLNLAEPGHAFLSRPGLMSRARVRFWSQSIPGTGRHGRAWVVTSPHRPPATGHGHRPRPPATGTATATATAPATAHGPRPTATATGTARSTPQRRVTGGFRVPTHEKTPGAYRPGGHRAELDQRAAVRQDVERAVELVSGGVERRDTRTPRFVAHQTGADTAVDHLLVECGGVADRRLLAQTPAAQVLGRRGHDVLLLAGLGSGPLTGFTMTRGADFTPTFR